MYSNNPLSEKMGDPQPGNNGLPKTFVSTDSFGPPGQTSSMLYPSSMFYSQKGPVLNPGTTGGMHINYHNANSFRQSIPTTAQIIAGALRDDSQMKYGPGQPLWIFRAEDTCGGDQSTLYSIHNINYALETAVRNTHEIVFDTFYDSIKNRDTTGKPNKRRKQDSVLNMDLLPLSMEELANSLRYIGVCQQLSHNSFTQLKNRGLAYASRYETSVPNVWGPTQLGDTLYWRLAMTQGLYDAYYNLDGVVVGPPTKEPFPQILPYYEKSSKGWIHSSAFLNPKIGDLDCYEQCLVAQKTYKYQKTTIDPHTGLVVPDHSSPLLLESEPLEELTPLVYKKYTIPTLWKVGTVTAYRGNPDNMDLLKPLRNVGLWEKQIATSQVTINLQTIQHDLNFV